MTNNKDEEQQKKVASELEALLIKNNLALVPFLHYSEFGIVPRVRLSSKELEDNKNLNDEQKANTTKPRRNQRKDRPINSERA